MVLAKSVRPEDLGIGKLFERIRDAVIVADAATQQIVLWNPAATNIFGYSATEALKLRVEALIPKRLKAKHQTGMFQYAETGHGPYIDSYRQLELPALKKGGEEIHVEFSLSSIEPVDDTNGGGRFVLAIIRNITERKRVEDALRESEKRYRAVVEQALAGIFLVDVDTKRILEANTEYQRLLGYAPEEILGLTLYDVVAHDRESIDFYTQRVLDSEKHVIGERQHRRKDGSLVDVVASASRISYGDREAISVIVHDITERKQAEERLREANRRLEEFAALRADFTAMVAHEIGSPLATIRGFLDMLSTGELEPADQTAVLAKIQVETNRLSTLVADVRSAAAIERDDFALVPRRTSVDELLEDATRFAETLPGGHPLVVEAATEEQVWADRYRIGQVLRNLLSNAAKYSPDGAPIELRAVRGEAPGRIRIEVTDHGCGVHPDDVERIFEKFGRGRGQPGRKAYGVGLGLYLSRRIVRAHGSELTLNSTPGTGSVFGFELEVTR